MKDTFFSSNLKLNIKGILKEFDRPLVMGILNATPDSFYAQSRNQTIESALITAERMIADGAAILDIGGYSSRPGAAYVDETEEIDRILPVIEQLKKALPTCLISIDTFRAKVADLAISNGADIINDISGGQIEPQIFEVAAKHQVPYILMHMRGTPQNMMSDTNYVNLIEEISAYFKVQIAQAEKKGVKDIILDPGFGFSKTLEQNYELLYQFEHLHKLNKPILIGVSRKSMITKKLEINNEEALNGTTVINTIGLMKGGSILRVHDVKEAMEAVNLVSAVMQGG